MTHFIFLYFDKINIIFLVGNIAISKIYFTKSIDPNIDWIGDLNVSTKVSCKSILKITGNILPGFSKWFDRFCLLVVYYPFSFKYYDWIGMLKSNLSFYFTWTTTQIDMVSWANSILIILCKFGHEKAILCGVGFPVIMGHILTRENSST